MSLATLPKPNGQLAQVYQQQPQAIRLSMHDAWDYAGYIKDSNMIVGANQAQIFTLMQICEAENIHYIEAIRQYDIIEGRPALKAAAMQAKFQSHGGCLEWVRFDDDAAIALFSHPQLHPKPVEVAVTYEDCLKRGLPNGKDGIKKNWRCHRAAMLRARCISAGVRMVYPGIVVGVYTPEEIEDMEPRAVAFDANAYVANPPKIVDVEVSQPPQAADIPVIGWTGSGYDTRAYIQVAKDAASEGQRLLGELYSRHDGTAPKDTFTSQKLHGELFKLATAEGLTARTATSSGQALTAITEDVYPSHRAWVRESITKHIESQLKKVQDDFEIAQGPGDDSDDDAFPPGKE